MNGLSRANFMLLRIRNMESERCKMVVKSELNKLGLHFKTVELGEIVLNETISTEYYKLLDVALKNSGLEIMQSKENILIEKIKNAINELIYLSDNLPKLNYSKYISKKVNYDYAYLSNLFSSVLGVTIERYVIMQKIERVKELLVYGALSLNDIAFKLQYSSVAHLSNQFKKVTGLTPSFFRQNENTRRQKI